MGKIWEFYVCMADASQESAQEFWRFKASFQRQSSDVFYGCFTVIWFDFQADLRESISSNACQIHNSTLISQTAVNTPSILHSSMAYSILIGLSILLHPATDFLHAVLVLYFSYHYAVCFCYYNKYLIYIRQISMWKVEQCTVSCSFLQKKSLQSH